MRHSAHTVTYRDILALVKEVRAERETWLSGARRNGTSNLDALIHKVETAKTLERMINRHLPGRQTNFFEVFQEVKK